MALMNSLTRDLCPSDLPEILAAPSIQLESIYGESMVSAKNMLVLFGLHASQTPWEDPQFWILVLLWCRLKNLEVDLLFGSAQGAGIPFKGPF